jgi:glutaredoxin
MRPARPHLARFHAAASVLVLVTGSAFMAGDASAQQIYKSVGPDGRVTFSDKPPLDPGTRASAAAVVPLASNGSGLAGLPYELRQAAARYPVTIYTSPGCSTCAQGRAMLVSRGIPFAEKTVSTQEDVDALTRLTGAASLPVLTIGAQQLKGFSDSEWRQFLDAAGYPKTSQLPPSYVAAAATPLVALDPPAPAAARAAQPPGRRAAAPAAAQPPADNPAGIQF